nr:hypothetical protein [Tanacetum cinerariifolium]
MSYPRFTKIIIDYFMSMDQSMSRRKKMFWHTARDDTMYTSMRCICRHEKTQVYGAILPKELTNQAMLKFEAYKTYYAFTSGEKTQKPKCVRKKDDSETSPKQKPVQATKDDVDINDVESADNDDSDDERMESDSDVIPDPNKTNVEHNKEEEEYDDEFNLEEDENIDEEIMYDDEDDEVTKELYEDVNVNLENKDADMTNADQDVVTPVIEKNVTKSLEVSILTRSSYQPTSSYEAPATLFEFELTKILINKMEKNKSFDVANYKRELYDALVKSYNTNKDIFESYGVEMKKTKIETPPLDQTEGRKEENQVKMPSHPEIQGQRKRSIQAPLKTPHNLNMSLPDIDKQLYQKRLMWNLEKFVGERIYENHLRLLERTI